MLGLSLSLLFALFSGAVALWLYRTEPRRTTPQPEESDAPKEGDEPDAPKEGEEPEEQTAPEDAVRPPERKEPGMAVFLIMILCNLGVTLFRRLFYQCPALDLINLALLFGVLWPCALLDWREFRIPNRFLLVGLLGRCATLAASAVMEPGQLGFVLLRCAVAAAALFIVSMLCRLIVPHSIGFGDVKLLMLMGLYLSTEGIWGAIFFTMIAAFAVSLVLIITKKANRKTEIPFAPFLLVGTILSSVLTYY